MKLLFSELDKIPRYTTGIYEIYTQNNVALKVGIAKDLKKRLTQHKQSRQNRLKKKEEIKPFELSNVKSKQSILTMHLYFDTKLSKQYNLKTENGRQNFLLNECYILVKYTNTREEAREIEKNLEKTNKFRYIGRVQNR